MINVAKYFPEGTEIGKPLILDLSSSDGNAFYILGAAKRLGRELDYSTEEMHEMLTEMRNGDYNHLIKTFKQHFSSLVEVVGYSEI